MVVVFILQIAVSIFSFTLINQTQYAVSRQLERMMGEYSYESYGYKAEIDWIQSKVDFTLNVIVFTEEITIFTYEGKYSNW